MFSKHLLTNNNNPSIRHALTTHSSRVICYDTFHRISHPHSLTNEIMDTWLWSTYDFDYLRTNQSWIHTVSYVNLYVTALPLVFRKSVTLRERGSHILSVIMYEPSLLQYTLIYYKDSCWCRVCLYFKVVWYILSSERITFLTLYWEIGRLLISNPTLSLIRFIGCV